MFDELEIDGDTFTNVPASPDVLMELGFSEVEASQMVADYEAKVQAVEARQKAKQVGEEYANTGVIVPFRSQDAMGLLQVKAAFELGAASTTMLFSNGQKLPMTAEDFPAFAVWFTQKRNSFFQDT